MPSPTTLMPTLLREHRRHPRAQLSLAVRLRWLTPLGQLSEVAQTLDVCRGGLLVYRRESCGVGAMVWVTLPFDSALALTEPETPARVVRVKTTPAGGHLVALQFEAPRRRRDTAGAANRTYSGPAREHRWRERIRLALPIHVRPVDSPWPEETMTVDISETGVLFCTTRLYAVGDTVHLTIPPGSFGGRWAAHRALPARVVRVEPGAGRTGWVWQQVAVALLAP